MALHLQDNGGKHNQHQLPFDGCIDWVNVMKKIALTGYQGATTLEPMNWDYEHLSIQEFLDLAYQRAKKIDAFSDDLRTYGFGPTGYDDYDKELENIQQYPTYKIVLDGKIIGGLTCCNEGEYYWLGGIYISKEYQNQGIGAKAISFIEKEFPDAKCWRLHTPYKNYRNHHFYEKMGYKKIGETEPREDKNGFFLYEYEKKIR